MIELLKKLSLPGLLLAIPTLVASYSAPAVATSITLAPDGSWNVFDVDQLTASDGSLNWIDLNDGSPLSFTFTVPNTTSYILNVVDGGFAGDTFSISSNGSLLGTTSDAVNSYPTSIGLNFDAAFANPNYSKATYIFNTGTYAITGSLLASVLDSTGTPINATVGAVKLTTIPAPENPLMGLGLLGMVLYYKSRK